MIITRTPIRLSLFGGGTDYPDYFMRKGGLTLSMAINKYSIIVINENKNNFTKNFILSYRKKEKVKKISKIKHNSVKSCLKFLKIKNFLEIHYISDIPAMTGLGSSSSFTVGLLKGLYKLKNKKISNLSIGKNAIYVEQKLNKERVGCQDQISCAMGGLSIIKYKKKKIFHKKFEIEKKRLNLLISNLLLFYTGKTRLADKVLIEQTKRTKNKKNDVYLNKIKKITSNTIKKLKNSNVNLDFIGKNMNECWNLKKKLSSKVTNMQIDFLYQKAINNGALGGKILGAGSGGFLLFYVPKNKQKQVINKLSNLKLVKFKIDNLGSSIIK